jgi:CubicO group peptidase (beta-lactamase class C family)
VRDAAHLRSLVEDGRRAFGVPGLSVALTDRERTLWTDTLGEAELAGSRPVEPGTLFQIGSISKSFAALAVLREVERGRLELDVPVTEYLPWFRLRAGTEHVTLHRLLSHTAGLVPGMDPTPSSLGEALVLARTEARAPGAYRYSNAAYAVVGLILERVTGLPIGEALRQAVFEPAGMTATEAVVTNALRARSAVGYEPLDDSLSWRPGAPLAAAPWAETDSAAGSISSTAEDLAAYARVFLRDGGGVVSAESLERMLTTASEPDQDGIGYGYGMIVEARPEPAWIGHGGSTPGFTASLQIDRAAGIGVAVLCNLGDVGLFAPGRIADTLLETALAGGREDAPPARAWPETTSPAGTQDDSIAPELRAYVGHYRSHSPWTPGFHVLVRDGGLALRLPSFEVFPLERRPDGTFGVDDEVEGPSQIEFGELIDGRTARATCDGIDLYRVSW